MDSVALSEVVPAPYYPLFPSLNNLDSKALGTVEPIIMSTVQNNQGGGTCTDVKV